MSISFTQPKYPFILQGVEIIFQGRRRCGWSGIGISLRCNRCYVKKLGYNLKDETVFFVIRLKFFVLICTLNHLKCFAFVLVH